MNARASIERPAPESTPPAPATTPRVQTEAPGTDLARAAVGCPYLRVAGTSWRAIRPLREHRCTAVVPADAPSLETQRGLCLVATHRACPRFLSMAAERRARWPGAPADLPAFEARVARRVPRVIPVALDRPSAMVGRVSLRGGGRRFAGLALAAAMVGAALLLVAARYAGDAFP